MTESYPSQSKARDQGKSPRPIALGIVATERDEEGIYRSVLRALFNDFSVYLVPWGISAETESLLDQTETTFVEASNCHSIDDAWDRLIDAARVNGAAGIVLCENLDRIDLDQCRDVLTGSSAFAVSAPTTESVSRLVGIPAYNESVAIGSTVLEAQQYADEVVVIDDGSSDGTVRIAREAGATVLEHEKNQGKGYALRTFFDYARGVDVDSVVVLDGDGQHFPSNIPEVVDPIERGDADFTVGSRYLEGDTGETPFHRRFGQQVLDFLTLGSSGTKLSDTQSGFRAFSPEAIDSLSIRTDGMGVESELVGTAVDSDLKIEEVPINVRYEGVDGQTYNPLRHGLSVATFLLQLIRDRHPLLFFGLPGLVFVVLGGILGVNTIIAYTGQGSVGPGQIIGSVFLTMIGVFGVFCGLILNRISNMITKLSMEAPQ